MNAHLLACLLLVPTCQALELACPATPQQAAEGWQPWRATPPSAAGLQPQVPAWRIELYEGDPALAGQRLADDFAEAVGVAPLQWTLDGQASLHLVCSYHDSALRQVRALPPGLVRCQADNEFEDQRLQLTCR